MKKKELSRVSKFFQATEARRVGLAETYRSELVQDLTALGTARSAAVDSLVEIAVSSRLVVAELTARYSRGRASDQDLVHLTHARAQLARALKALGLVAAAVGEPEEPAGPVAPSPAEWLRNAAAQPALSNSDEAPPDAA
jgi:hypothetical protein